jgi:hypothetical protein
MAVINQSPLGQTSIAISGISFAGLMVGSGDPFRDPAVRVQDGGPSVAISFGAASVSLVGAAITLLDAPGDNAVSLATMAAAKITSTRINRLVAVDDPSPGTLVHVGQSAAEVAKVAGSNRLVAVSNLSAGTLAAVQQDGMDVVVVAANP